MFRFYAIDGYLKCIDSYRKKIILLSTFLTGRKIVHISHSNSLAVWKWKRGFAKIVRVKYCVLAPILHFQAYCNFLHFSFYPTVWKSTGVRYRVKIFEIGALIYKESTNIQITSIDIMMKWCHSITTLKFKNHRCRWCCLVKICSAYLK